MTSKLNNDEMKSTKRSSSINKTISNQNHRMKHTADVFPSLKKDLQNAKLFLQQSSNASGDSIFEHLTNVITQVIDERPSNVVDYFELYSEKVRLEKFRMQNERIEDAYKEPDRLTKAQRMLPECIEEYEKHKKRMNRNEVAYTKSSNSDVMNIEEEEEVLESDIIYYESPVVKDLCELQFYWNLLGIGFPREETFSLSCAMRRLKMNASISTCRFWGKIFGLKNDYYIAECTLTEDALEKRIDAIEKAINITSLEPLNLEFSDQQRKSSSNASSMSLPSGDVRKMSEIGNSTNSVVADVNASDVADNISNNKSSSQENETIDPKAYPAEWNFSMNIPQTSYRRPIEIPAEDIGHGVNRYVYYVLTNLYDEDWIELPLATPHQINVSRRIQKYLTGNLDTEILSYPSFPGTERNYLRAIIARISASTHVAPRNFYEIGNDIDDGDNDEEEEDFDEDKCNNDKPIKVNASYRPLPLEELLKLDYWVHIRPNILKQGRVCYFDGTQLLGRSQANDDSSIDLNEEQELEDDEEDEQEITNIKMKPEKLVPLFTSCSGDRLTNDIISPWTIRLSDVIVESPLVLLQSNIWSGAYTFVKDRICDNIYIGYGHKYTSLNYSPTAFLPQLQMEYPHGVDIEEANDPSVDDEKEWQRQYEEKNQNNQRNDDDDVSNEEEINN